MIPSNCCDVETCCDSVYDLCSNLAHTVARALADCQPTSACDDLDVFVSHGRPIGPGHYVAAWLVRQRYATTRTNIIRPIPTIAVRYVEPGFPGVRVVGGQARNPDRADLDAASRHSYSHAMTMVNAIRSTVADRLFGGCNEVTIDRVEPDPIQAYHGGWTIEATWGSDR